MREWHAPAAAGWPGQLECAPDSATKHGMCSHEQSSRAKRGEEEKLLAGFAGQITAFLRAGEWIQKRKCAKRAAPQMLRGEVIPTRLEIRDDEVEFFWFRR